MTRVQEQKHLAQANRHTAELTVQIVRQRAIVKRALDTGQPSEMAESLLHALEERLGAFEKHRELVLDVRVRGSSKRPDPSQAATGRDLSSAPGWSAGANDQLTNATLAASFGTQNCYLAMAAMRRDPT